MADLKELQKKIANLLYQQLLQYFAQIQILSYKPSADGTVSGKFIGDQRNYNFILKGQQVQYLPTTTNTDRLDANVAVTSCSGSNHPCKGAKGTRCVPENQSCKQRESSPEGIARLNDISSLSKQITSLVVAPKDGKESTQKAVLLPKGITPEKAKDISLYEFFKHYAPLNPKASTASLADKEGKNGFSLSRAGNNPAFRKGASTKKQTSNSKPSRGTLNPSAESVPEQKRLGAGSSTNEPKKKKPSKPVDPYKFLGLDKTQFKNEDELYSAARKAYKELAQKYHPDKGGDPKKMIRLNEIMSKLKAMRKDSLRSHC
jgi:hypothetical protein